MAQAATADDTVLEDQPQPVETPGETLADPQPADVADEVVVSIGDPEPASEEDEHRAPEWVRELRKSNREKDRRLRELEQENTRLKGSAAPAAVVVGEKPTLEGCAYDGAKFEAELTAWHERKRQADEHQAAKEAEQKKQAEAWTATVESYQKKRSDLKAKLPDFDDAEDAVKAACSTVQQSILLDAADNPALVIAALGKNPAKLKEIAAMSNPVKFTAAIAKLETQLKLTPKKSAPPPERRVQSTVAGAAAVDNELDKLRADAAKTGDLSKVLEYNRQKRAKT